MKHTITLKDISRATGVSLASVHRAINNREGIGDDLRQTILETARELGYKTNYAASSLKRKAVKIAILFPSAEGSGKYYYKYCWDACLAYQKEISGLNVEIIKFAFSGDEKEQTRLLREIYNNHSGELDGLLTVPLSQDKKIKEEINKFIEKDISVVLVDNDIPDTKRLCCISPHDTLTGRLGAEFLSSICPPKGKILMAAGSENNSSHIHNVRGFMNYLTENNIELEVHKIYCYDDLKEIYNKSKKFLESEKDVVGFYSATARETIPLCNAVIDTGLKGKIKGIASDLYFESAEMLSENVVQGLIYKNPYEKAYHGFKILFEYIIKKSEPESKTTTVPISLIMKSNLNFFTKFI